VIGGDYRALGVVRSLGRRGIPVWVVRSRDDHELSARSRYCRRAVLWPAEGDEERLDVLRALAHRHGAQGWVVFPSADATAAFVARQHTALEDFFRLTTPPWEVFEWAYDKRRTAELAQSLGVPHPSTRSVRDRGELEHYDGPFPVLLKPATKPQLNRPAAKAWRADDRAGLLRCYEEAAPQVEPGTLLLQELVPGGAGTQFSFAALCSAGQAVAVVTAERVRQNPPDFGRSSTFVRTVDDPQVEALGARVVAALGLTGLVEVEFKRDARDASLRLLDVNLRVWGWHTIARRHGLDFPYLAWRQALGEPVAPVRCPAGLRWLRMTTDVAAAARGIAAGELAPTSYLRSVVSRHERPVLAADDPLPALLEVPLYAARAFNNRRRRPADASSRERTSWPRTGLGGPPRSEASE
jgi:D-aspartate ligase